MPSYVIQPSLPDSVKQYAADDNYVVQRTRCLPNTAPNWPINFNIVFLLFLPSLSLVDAEKSNCKNINFLSPIFIKNSKIYAKIFLLQLAFLSAHPSQKGHT